MAFEQIKLVRDFLFLYNPKCVILFICHSLKLASSRFGEASSTINDLKGTLDSAGVKDGDFLLLDYGHIVPKVRK